MAPKRMSRKPVKAKKTTRRRVNPKLGNGSQLSTLNVMSDKPMRFQKTILNQITLQGASTSITGEGQFTIDVVPQFPELTALFNRYKLHKVILNIRAIDQQTGVSFAQSQMPTLYHRYNYDSNIAVVSIKDKLSNATNVNTFTFTLDKTKTQYTLVPKTVSPVYYSITSTGYKLNEPEWIDVAYPSVPHYGWMYYIDNLLTGFTIAVDVTYDFSMKYSD